MTLVRPDGQKVQELTLQAGLRVLGAAGAHVIVLREGGSLRGVRRDGTVVDLGNIGTNNPGGFVTSPDGMQWLWSTSEFQADRVHSSIHVGGIGLTSRVVAEATEQARALRPFVWTETGPLIEHGAVGIGGYILFSPATGRVDQLDLSSGSVRPVSGTADCALSDLARDGTMACFKSPRELKLISSSGQSRIVSLPAPRFNLAGDAYFKPGGAVVTIAGATGVGAAGQQEVFETDLVSLSDGSLQPFGPPGIRPALGRASWLADGSLIVWRPERAAGGEPGTYVLTPAGKLTKISPIGPPLGLLQ